VAIELTIIRLLDTENEKTVILQNVRNCYVTNILLIFHKTWIIKLIQGAVLECDDFQITVSMKWVEYKKHKLLQIISSKMPFNICFLLPQITFVTWSSWNAVHSCNDDLKLIITTQKRKICARHCSVLVAVELHITSHSLWHIKGWKGMSGLKLEPLINVCCEVVINYSSQLQECIACQVDNLGDVIYEKQKCMLHGTLLRKIRNFFLYLSQFIKTAIWKSSHSFAAHIIFYGLSKPFSSRWQYIILQKIVTVSFTILTHL
jgi:hypothetical protein